MFNFADYLILSGVPGETLYLILALPLIALLVSFFRYFVGLKTFGMYEPIVLAYALYAISADFIIGIKFGLPLIILAWLVSEITKRALEKARLHYIAKVSIKVSIASILYVVALIIAALLGKNGYFTVSPLSVVVIIALIEAVSLFQVKSGNLKTNLISAETMFMAIVSYFIISSRYIQGFFLSYPYFVIIPVVANFFVGKWSGLRLSEYIRFKDVSKDE
jgi:hypothetical protein